MPRRVRRGLAVALLALFAACRDEPAAAAPTAWRQCWLPGLEEPAECRTVEVPGGEHAPGQRVALFVARLRADRPDAARPPLFFLAGGPGQSATAVAGPMASALRYVRSDRDLIFVDQRGTGRSGAIGCELLAEGADPLRDVFSGSLDADAVRRCRARLPLPPLAYGTATASDDLDAVRRALGLPAIALYGVSYGTRLALVHLARHGDTVEAVILDGALPADVPLFATFDEDAEAALAALVRDCAGDAACHAAFPDPRRDLERVLSRAASGPKVRAPHPRTGAATELPIDRAGVALGVRALLYDTQIAANLPLAVSAAAAGDYASLWTAAALLVDGASATTDAGLMLAVVCAEDVPRLDPADPGSGFLGDAMTRQIVQACAIWDGPVAAPLPRARDAAQRPILVISGALDPVTPPRHIEAFAEQRGAVHLILPGVGHGAGRHGCGPRAMADFLAAPATARPDLACGKKTRRPRFNLGASAVQR